MVTQSQLDALVDEAIKGGENAYIPYSQYRVGAAVLTASGKVVHGCNIENASYSASMCGERVALFNAVSQGEKIIAIAIVTDNAGTSCGFCRQVMNELCPDATVILSTPDKKTQHVYTVNELLPHAFKLEN